MEFKKVKLGEVIKVQIDNRGRNPEKYINYSKFPVIDNYLIKNEKYPNIKNVNRYIDEDTKNNFLRGHLEKDDVIITLVGNGIGNVTMVPSSKCVIIQNTLGLRCNESMTNDFLYYTLISNRNKIVKYNRGSSQPSIRKTDLFSYEINIPTINYQKKITKILNSLDSKIEINNKIISNLESQAQAIFKSWFVDFEPFQDGNFVESELGMIPEGWEVKELVEVADFSNGYSFKSKDLLEEKKSKNDYKVFKQADIKVGGGINPNNTKSWIDSEFIRKNKLSRFIIQSGDLMMCMTDMKNNVRLLGNTALVYQPDEYILNQRVGRLRSKQKEIKPSFLYYLTNNSVFLNDLRGRANTGVQVNLSTSEIKRSKVILPTCDIIKRFCDYSESITKSINSLNSQNTKLAELRDALLPKLMAGEIDVSNIKIEGEEVKNE